MVTTEYTNPVVWYTRFDGRQWHGTYRIHHHVKVTSREIPVHFYVGISEGILWFHLESRQLIMMRVNFWIP